HYRLAHIGKTRMQKLHSEGLLENIDEGSFDKCESCISGKMTKKPFNKKIERATNLLGLIHTDVCEPLRHVQGKQNGVSERRNRTLLDMVRSMFNLTTLPLFFWEYALESAVRILNLVPTKKVEDDEVGDLEEPANYKTVMLDPDKLIWQGAMDEEMKFMKVNKVWIVVDRPPNSKVVRNKWLYKKKTDMDGK
nr:retrotransposon protein, putative, Ty1-copia subclass [Tanacetum cinerariifolium]